MYKSVYHDSRHSSALRKGTSKRKEPAMVGVMETGVGKDVEEARPSHTAAGNVNEHMIKFSTHNYYS